MDCAEQLRTQAFIDGELDGAASHDAERHIQGCPQCQAFVASAAMAGDLIRRHAQRHAAPDALRRKVADSLRTDPAVTFKPPARNFWLGAGSGAGLMALAASLALFLILPPSAATLSDALVDAHTAALMKGQTIQVASSNHHTVKPWFAGRVAISPPVADFARDGFTLTGGRLQHVAGTDMAVVVYRHDAHEIDLFAWADQGSRLPGTSLRHGYHAMFWKSGDLDFAAISDVDSTELEKFSHLVRGEGE